MRSVFLHPPKDFFTRIRWTVLGDEGGVVKWEVKRARQVCRGCRKHSILLDYLYKLADKLHGLGCRGLSEDAEFESHPVGKQASILMIRAWRERPTGIGSNRQANDRLWNLPVGDKSQYWSGHHENPDRPTGKIRKSTKKIFLHKEDDRACDRSRYIYSKWLSCLSLYLYISYIINYFLWQAW
jgi:hypothetical protein